MRRKRTLLLEVGLILAAIALSAILNNPIGYCIAAVLAVAFICAWYFGKEEDEEEFEGSSLFGGAIPTVAAPAPAVSRPSLPRTVVAVKEFQAYEPVQVSVTNHGEGAEFYAPLEIGEGIQGVTNGLFAKWAHTETMRAWIAKGETCHLMIARLDHNRMAENQSSAQWKVLALASDHNVRTLAARYVSTYIPLDKAPDVSISGSVISKPDAENGIQPFKVILEAFRAIDGTPALAQAIVDQCFPPSQPERHKSNLQVNWEGVIVGPVYLSDDGVWCASSSSLSSGRAYTSIRLQVTNRHVDGKKIDAAKSVSARIEFTYGTGVSGWTAAPAAWLNEESGTITVDPGYDKELLVAVRTGSLWNVVTNTRRSNGLPRDTTAMQFREAPWHDATMKVSIIHEGEAETREYEWSDIDERIIPRIRPIRRPS